MIVFRFLVSKFFALIITISPVDADEKTSLLSELQVSMQRHIDSQLINGAIHSLDLETGELSLFYPIETHSMVMAIDDDFILCTDLATLDGTKVPLDLYVTRTDDGFRVYQTEINNREPLEQLVKANRVERIR